MKTMIFAFVTLVLIFSIPLSPVAAQQTVRQTDAEQPVGGVQSLEDRMKHLEEAVERTVASDRWFDRVKVGGLVEVEAGYARIDAGEPDVQDEKVSDIDLGKVELTLDARIAAHVDGHIRITYEDDDLFLDEGFITLTGPERFPAYLIAGRQYIPFGHFESHFVTDPATLLLGETNEGAVVVGYPFFGDMFNISLGVFNGKVEKADTDDMISDYVGRIVISPRDGIQFGASYISNLAAADAFADVVTADLDDYVAGWSVFASATLFDRLTLVGEYVAALSRFQAGEIYAGDAERRRPAAWNVEMGYVLTEQWQVALRYGGSKDGDGGDDLFLPKTQCGAVVNWSLFDNTTLALEYLRSDFRNDQTVDAIVAQLAVAF